MVPDMTPERAGFIPTSADTYEIELTRVTESFFVEVIAGAKLNGSSVDHKSSGWFYHNGTSATNRAFSSFSDSTVHKSYEASTECLAHYDKVGGVLTKVLAGYITAVEDGIVYFTITAANGNHRVQLVVHPA